MLTMYLDHYLYASPTPSPWESPFYPCFYESEIIEYVSSRPAYFI